MKVPLARTVSWRGLDHLAATDPDCGATWTVVDADIGEFEVKLRQISRWCNPRKIEGFCPNRGCSDFQFIHNIGTCTVSWITLKSMQWSQKVFLHQLTVEVTVLCVTNILPSPCTWFTFSRYVKGTLPTLAEGIAVGYVHPNIVGDPVDQLRHSMCIAATDVLDPEK